MYNNLPFRIDVLERQQYQFNPNQPPVLFRVTVAPEFESMVPVFTAVLANEITNQANTSELRRFTFNQMSVNNWNNNDFMQAVQFAVGLGQLSLQKGMFHNIEHAVNEACAIAAASFASINVNNFPAIKQYMAQDRVYQAMQNINVFNNTMNEINMMFNTRGGMMPMQQQYPPVSQQFNQMANQPYNQPVNRNMGGSSFMVGQAPAMPMVNTSGSSSVSGDRYSERANVIRQSQPVAQEPVRSSYTPPVVQKVLSEEDWIPTAQQPHRTLFNVDQYYASYDQQFYNGTSIIFETIQQKEASMRREDHVVGALPGQHNIVEPRDINELDLPPALNKAVNRAIAVSSLEENQIDVATMDHWLNETSIDDAIFTARKRQHKSNNKALFSCNAFIAKPYIKTPEVAQLFEALTYTNKFYDMATIIDRAKNQNVAEAFSLDVMMTQLINGLLCNRLSLEMTIGSFCDDIRDVRTYLHKTYGPMWVDAWDSIEEELVTNNAIFGVEDTTTVDALTNVLSDDLTDENVDTAITNEEILLHIRRYNINLIDVLAKDLNYNLKPNEALLISPSISPALYRLAEYVFDEGVNNGIQVYVVVTKDNVKYQLSKGKMVKNSYLISLL